MALTKYKDELVAKKANHCLTFAIEKTDIVNVVSKAWNESFAWLQTNRNVIAKRGWGPLTYNVLLLKEVESTKPGFNDASTTQSNIPLVPVKALNLTEGFAGTIPERICNHYNREAARNGIDMDSIARQRQETAQAGIDSGRNYTAGLHFSAGHVAIGADVHEIQRNKKRQAEEERVQK